MQGYSCQHLIKSLNKSHLVMRIVIEGPDLKKVNFYQVLDIFKDQNQRIASYNYIISGGGGGNPRAPLPLYEIILLFLPNKKGLWVLGGPRGTYKAYLLWDFSEWHTLHTCTLTTPHAVGVYLGGFRGKIQTFTFYSLMNKVACHIDIKPYMFLDPPFSSCCLQPCTCLPLHLCPKILPLKNILALSGHTHVAAVNWHVTRPSSPSFIDWGKLLHEFVQQPCNNLVFSITFMVRTHPSIV